MGDLRQRCKSERNLRCLAVTHIVASCVLSVVIIIIVAIRINTSRNEEGRQCAPEEEEEKDSRRMDEKEYRRYCFRSSTESECLDRGYDVKLVNNRSVCCGNFNEHVYGVLSEELSQRLKRDAYRAWKLNKVKGYITRVHQDPAALTERPVAHVGILQNGNLTVPDSKVPRVQWEQSGERSFVTGGIVHGGDRLRVTIPGYYFVYTGLQFNVNPGTISSGAIVAYLYRHMNGSRESRQKLMTLRESSCRMTRADVTGPVSMYTAGIYLLRNGDEVSVITSSHSSLHRSSATTYLGLHMV